MIQQKINANAALKGHLVSVGLDGGGKIQITSQQYGSASKVEITGGTAWSVLGFAGNESATGTDVTGHFIANGQTETATGSGQLLTGADGNTNTSGLQVRATMNTPGSANVTVTQGLASRLSQVLNRYLDPVNGRFKTIDEGYKANIDDIEKTIVRQNEVLDEKTLQLQAQFAAMEAAVNQLKGLQNQFSSLLPTITPNNR
jgi:flagellar hook-associated protein 2